VTDDEGSSVLLIEPLEITVSLFMDPIAIADLDTDFAVVGYSVLFSGAGSYDPDGGLITKFEWDWENDDTIDYSDSDENASHVYHEPGNFQINLRVTDDEAAQGELDEPLEIIIYETLPFAVAEASKLQSYGMGRSSF
jgi:PKD repeat protein